MRYFQQEVELKVGSLLIERSFVQVCFKVLLFVLLVLLVLLVIFAGCSFYERKYETDLFNLLCSHLLSKDFQSTLQ